jgi:hypothetical protein
MAIDVVTREEWGARPARGLTPQNYDKGSTLFIHWSASHGHTIDAKGERKAAMREIQRFHQDVRKWADIGYSYVVFQPYGIFDNVGVFEGRSFSFVPAAQSGYNTDNGAVCVVMAPGEKLKWRTRRKLKALARQQRARNVSFHGFDGSTQCPGPALTKFVKEKMRGYVRLEKRKPFLP